MPEAPLNWAHEPLCDSVSHPCVLYTKMEGGRPLIWGHSFMIESIKRLFMIHIIKRYTDS